MKYLLSTSILFLFAVSLFAQQGIVKGIVMDSIGKEPLEFVSVRLFSPSDTIFIKGTFTDKKGIFTLPADLGSYFLEISFIGYKKLNKNILISEETPSLSLGTIFLYEDSNLLDQVVITAKVPDIEVKGDTIEYNAAAYMNEENDLLQDLIKNIPGVQVDDDGNLTMNGKVITKILVDGKEFFNNDIKMALQNLPANMIKKIQLFQEQSEQSKTSGIKDNEGEQVLNLEVKEEFKQSVFGNATAGYGSDERYIVKGMANTLRNDNQLSVIAGGNNTNQGIESMGMSGVSGATQSLGGGIDDKKEVAINFNHQKSDTLQINGNVRYSKSSNLLKEYTRTEYIDAQKGNWMNIQNERSENKRQDLNMDFNIKWRPDSLTSVYFRSSAGYSDSDDFRNSEFTSYYVDSTEFINKGWSDYRTNGSSKNISGSLSAGRKLSSKGRNISLYLNGSIRDVKNNGTNKSLTEYSSSNVQDRLIDQKLNRNNNSKNFSVSFSYVEPITDKNTLNFTYSYTQNSGNNINDTYKIDPLTGEYTVLDTLYARKSKNRSHSQRIEVGFQALHEKYEYNIGFNVNPYHSHNTTSFRDSIIDDLKQNVVNYSPRIRFRYKRNQNTSFDFNYSGRTNYPLSRQLSADTTIISPSNKEYGNPDLKPSFENRFDMNFQQSNYEKGSFLYVRIGFNNTLNQIASYSKVDDQLNTERTYKNVSGNWGGNISIMLNTPIKKDKLTFSTYSSVNYNRGKSFVNANENTSNNTSINESVSFSFRSKKMDTRLYINGGYNLTKNTLEDQRSIETGYLMINNSLNIRLPFDFRLENEIGYSHRYGYSSDLKNSEVMWNASLSKSFLKKKMGILSLQLYDILKDQNPNIRYTDEGYTVDKRSNMIGQYFMLTFTYRFNITRGGGSNQDSAYPEYYNY